MYNAKNVKVAPGLPSNTNFQGIIIGIDDGTPGKFLTREQLKDWHDIDSPAIQVQVEVKHEEKSYIIKKIFGYSIDGENTVIGKRSNMGKFKEFYGSTPEVGQVVECRSNVDGFLRLLFES